MKINIVVPKDILQKCLHEFTENKETTNGTTILGFPIGSTNYLKEKMSKLTKK